MLVSIIIVNWNHKKYLPRCLDSVMNQTLKDFEVIIIDNNSEDGSKELVHDFSSKYEKAILIENKNNLGFAQGNNQGIKQAKGRYILCLNPDVVLDKNFIRNGVEFFENNKNCGAISGKLLKYDFDRDKKLPIIDSTGLIIYKNRRVFDRNQGEQDSEKFNITEKVFGVSAAAAFYRKDALESVKIDQEYFDNDFFAYKEDIDLSWRLRLFGWQIWYLPSCLGYHARGTGVLSDKSTAMEIMKNRKEIVSKKVKILSYRNQRLMQVKNEFWLGFFIHSPFIIIKELGILFYILFFEIYLTKAFIDIIKLTPRMIQKRKLIMHNKKVDWREMSKWFQ